MANDHDSEESQFVVQSGDEENLWEILGIIAEKGNKYKVKWAGDDPKTGKPWGNSWVKKSDVTPDVVQEWKEKQAQKVRRKSSTKNVSKAGSRKSATSTTSKRAASTSTATTRRGRASVAWTVKQEPSPSTSRSPPPPPSISASPPKTTGKRKLSVASNGSEPDFPDLLSLLREGSEPQKKRRKVAEEVEEASPKISKLRREAVFNDVLEEEEAVTTKRTVRKTRSSIKPAATTTMRNGRTNGKGKSKEIAVYYEDVDEGSGTEVMKQLTNMNGKLSDSEDEANANHKTRRPTAALSKSAAKPPGRATKRIAQDESEAEDEDCLTPWARRRLEEFDDSMRLLLENEATSGSEQPAAVPYGESDVDSTAVGIMYPPEEDEGIASPSKRKALQRESTVPDEVPEVVVQQPASPGPQESRPVPGTPSRSSLKSKMKPRTPRSAAGSLVSFADIPEVPAMDMDDLATEPPTAATAKSKGMVNSDAKPKAKPKPKPKMGPIPQISPSKFFAHLPKSSMVDTTIEEAEEEIEEPMSSIEQFDSPEKQAKIAVVPHLPSKAKGKQRASPIESDSFWEGNIIADVQRMRDRAAGKEAKNRMAEQNGAVQRRQLDEIIQRRLTSSRPASERSLTPPRSPSKPTPPPPPPQEEIMDDEYDDFYVDDEPTMNQDTQTEEQSAVPAVPLFLPEEEEESTQDLLHEMEVQKAMSEGAVSRSPTPEPEMVAEDADADAEGELDVEEAELVEDVDDAVDVSMEPQIGTHPEDIQYPPEEQEESQIPAQVDPPSKLAAGTQEIPATFSTRQEESSQESVKTNTTIDSTEQKEHIGYMNLLNAKSEEINDLGKQLQDERAQREQFASRVAALEEQLLAAQVVASDVQKQTAAELAQKLEESNAQLAEMRKTLETEQEAWRVRLEKAQEEVKRMKASYDNVMDMFREANGRVDVLSREKKALRKELEISQKQARESVVVQKAMFENQVKKAEKEMEDWKKVATLVLTRNNRSDADDEMRKRASEAQELRAALRQEKGRNQKLKAKLKRVRRENGELRVLLDELPEPEGSDDDSEVSRSPVSSPHRSHRSPSPRPDRSPSPQHDRSPSPEADYSPDEYDFPRSQAMEPEEEDDETEEERPDDIVKACLWTFEDGSLCKALFKDTEKLKAHYIDAGHLPRPARPIDGLD